MYRLASAIAITVLVLLQYKLLGSPEGMQRVWALEKSLAEQRDRNDVLQQRNGTLAAEVDELRVGREAIEERARAELGMLKPSETFFQIVDVQSPPPKTP